MGSRSDDLRGIRRVRDTLCLPSAGTRNSTQAPHSGECETQRTQRAQRKNRAEQSTGRSPHSPPEILSVLCVSTLVPRLPENDRPAMGKTSVPVMTLVPHKAPPDLVRPRPAWPEKRTTRSCGVRRSILGNNRPVRLALESEPAQIAGAFAHWRYPALSSRSVPSETFRRAGRRQPPGSAGSPRSPIRPECLISLREMYKDSTRTRFAVAGRGKLTHKTALTENPEADQ